ncbi:hypothetical protein R1flu_026178 [Riccia fluitans]|uniref:Protein kinase domain-containing protein n=1 Tax=Riccia fluitans TaxID=41844 RepID=A0ABD1XF98_9MARC
MAPNAGVPGGGGSTVRVLSLTYDEVLLATKNFMVQYPAQITGSVSTYNGLLTEFPYRITVKIYFMGSFGRQRLRAELRAMKFCRHDNIVRYFGGRSLKGELFMGIYETLSHGTLQGLLYAAPNEKLSWDTRLKIALDVANGLFYLHEGVDDRMHVMHCNLSPSAIFFSGLTAKIGRFELSRLVKDKAGVLSADHIPLGKLGYMPPEIMTSRVVSKAADVYSFGVIILELITRRHPHKPGWSSEGVRSSFDSDRDLSKLVDPTLLPELDAIEDSVLAVLVDVGLRCTEMNPEKRPTMAEVVATLESIMRKSPAEEQSLGYSATHQRLFGYTNELPDKESKILRGSKETKSSYSSDINNLQIRLLFDSLDGNGTSQKEYRHGILPFIGKQWRKLSSRFRRKKMTRATACTDSQQETEAIDFDEIEKEQEYLASVIIEKRKQGNTRFQPRVASNQQQSLQLSPQGRHENTVVKSLAGYTLTIRRPADLFI